MLAVIKKELKSYFFSPIGYVVIGIFLLCFSVFFYLTVLPTGSVDLSVLYYYTALYHQFYQNWPKFYHSSPHPSANKHSLTKNCRLVH